MWSRKMLREHQIEIVEGVNIWLGDGLTGVALYAEEEEKRTKPTKKKKNHCRDIMQSITKQYYNDWNGR